MSFISRVIGLPYCLHNMHGLSCWGLVAAYYKDKGVSVKSYTADALTARAVSTAFTLAFMNGDHGFKVTDTPKNGDVVIFKSKTQTHCGLWLNGKILHSSPAVNGVAYQCIDDIKGFDTVEFWAYDKD